jgi:hypothetical protein
LCSDSVMTPLSGADNSKIAHKGEALAGKHRREAFRRRFRRPAKQLDKQFTGRFGLRFYIKSVPLNWHRDWGPVAQGIEQQPSKLKVAGSNPAGVANKNRALAFQRSPIPCRIMLQTFSLRFNKLQTRTATPCDTDATGQGRDGQSRQELEVSLLRTRAGRELSTPRYR